MIVENSGAPALRLFPVPADDHVTIIWPHEAMGFDWKVYDACGHEVLVGSASSAFGEVIDLRGLHAGVYVVHAYTASRTARATVLKDARHP
ncbi:MAG: T9SS type A sorting domain-containing protein [Flavobacteriales bacterium]|nr:T9SS type A sorting domain-containing protein [Flavobacteriales bacterium]